MKLVGKQPEIPAGRPLAAYMADSTLIGAIVEGTEQGHIDGYNLGREFRTPLSVGGYVYAQVAYHIMSRLRMATYSGLRLDTATPTFQFAPYKNQIRIEIQGLFPTPVRLLLRSGKLAGNHFEVAPIGPVTVAMLKEDHGAFVKPSPSLFEPNPQPPEKLTEYIDLYIVYDWAMSETKNPHLSTYLVFPLPAGLKKCALPFLDHALLKTGEIGPNGFNPIEFSTDSNAADIDFDVLEKNVVGL